MERPSIQADIFFDYTPSVSTNFNIILNLMKEIMWVCNRNYITDITILLVI